jgi:hypothetical protein
LNFAPRLPAAYIQHIIVRQELKNRHIATAMSFLASTISSPVLGSYWFFIYPGSYIIWEQDSKHIARYFLEKIYFRSGNWTGSATALHTNCYSSNRPYSTSKLAPFVIEWSLSTQLGPRNQDSLEDACVPFCKKAERCRDAYWRLVVEQQEVRHLD